VLTKGLSIPMRSIEGLREYYPALSEAANFQSVLDSEMATFAETVNVVEKGFKRLSIRPPIRDGS